MLALLPWLASCSLQSLWGRSPLSLNISAVVCTLCFVILGIRALRRALLASRLCAQPEQQQSAVHERDNLDPGSASAMEPIKDFKLTITQIENTEGQPKPVPLDGISRHLAQMMRSMCEEHGG
jgi:hypothetical protein